MLSLRKILFSLMLIASTAIMAQTTTVKGNVTDKGTWTLSGDDSTLVFTGDAAQIFIPDEKPAAL